MNAQQIQATLQQITTQMEAISQSETWQQTIAQDNADPELEQCLYDCLHYARETEWRFSMASGLTQSTWMK